MPPAEPSADSEAAAPKDEAAKRSPRVRSLCGPWWRWGPLLLVTAFCCFVLDPRFSHLESLKMMETSVPPLLMLMFVQLFILGIGLGYKGFFFALLRLFFACALGVLCMMGIMGVIPWPGDPLGPDIP